MEPQPHLLLQTAGACFPSRPAETPQVDRTQGSGPSLDSQPPAPGDHVSGGVGAVAALTASKQAYTGRGLSPAQLQPQLLWTSGALPREWVSGGLESRPRPADQL